MEFMNRAGDHLMKINEIIIETTSGGIAVVAQPLGAVIKRPNPSVYKSPKKKKAPKKESSVINTK